jgi:signal transduction histidine kinase
MAGRAHSTPTARLLIALAAILLAASTFSYYAVSQIDGLRELQQRTIDTNRRASLQLLRIQNDLNQMGLAMRDMVDGSNEYGLEAWRGEFERIRYDLEDAIRKEELLSARPREQRDYLNRLSKQFWTSVDQIFEVAEKGDQKLAKRMVVDSLQAQQSSLSATVARLLVLNNEFDEKTTEQVTQIYDRVERNIYIFLAAMLAGIAAIGLFVTVANRRMFERIHALSEQKATLARRLIGLQEEIFGSVARELHDDFGQVLTAVGVMLQRVQKREASLRDDLSEIRAVVQEAIEKTRSFAQTLHPTILDDYGLEKAAERYVSTFARQTGISVTFQHEGISAVPTEKAIHVYRVLQEALTNIAKHSHATEASVSLTFSATALRLNVRDNGVGKNTVSSGKGLGLVAMKERADILDGQLLYHPQDRGTLVTLDVPL